MEKKPMNNKDYNGDDKLKKHRRPMKKKVCEFCEKDIPEVDYKDVARLKRYITEKGKLISARSNGCCAAHQRQLAVAVKRARMMALLPFKGE